MAVYTPVSLAAAQALADTLSLGQVCRLEGIQGGIENTNYFVDTLGPGPTGGPGAAAPRRWVLTLFERLDAESLPFYLGLMQHLAAAGLPVPAPCALADGQMVHRVCGRPAALVSCLSGRHLEAPDLHHCAQVGAVLARLHRAASARPGGPPNPRGLAWCQATGPSVQGHLNADQRSLLADELAFQALVATSAHDQTLPRAPVHADLFRDNVLFDGLPAHERLTGCIDFYFAGVDRLVYDLAVALNDWCLAADGISLDEDRCLALVQAYQRERPMAGAEARELPAMLRLAALRFWLSRLADWHGPRDATLLAPKDPTHFERVLRSRREAPWHPGL